MRNKWREEAAMAAAGFLRKKLDIKDAVRTAMVLGTGWGDTLELKNEREARLDEIPGFGRLCKLTGHERRIVCGELNDREVLLLRGRVHLNEAPDDPNLLKQVRLQIEMLFHLGVTNLVLTCAAGSLLDEAVHPGDLVIITDFVTLFAPPMPLWVGEFCSPQNALSEELQKLAKMASGNFLGKTHFGAYVMIRGPQFDGLLDKKIMAAAGATVVGMSTYPEVCVASLYPEVKALAVAFVTNGLNESHNHASNLDKAKENASYLGNFLVDLVHHLS